MCHACNEKWQTTSNWRNGTTKQGENETYKYLGILEADTIKQVAKKRKPYERNGISPISSTGLRHQNQSYKNEDRQISTK